MIVVFSCVGFSAAHVWALCSLSRVKGGVERCGVCHACPVLRGRRVLAW